MPRSGPLRASALAPVAVTIGRRVKATLYAVPGSHPSQAVELMLRHKSAAVRRVDLVPVQHRAVVRALGFPRATVPAVRADGIRLQGSRTISRALDALQPEPRLFPRERALRAAVESAEAWGDEVLQPVARRLAWAALRRDRAAVGAFLERGRIGVPRPLARRLARPIVAAGAWLNGAGDASAPADLAALPALLERVDALVGAGVLGASERNAADFQIAASLRLLMAFEDLRPALDDRPAGRLALEVAPDVGARLPPLFPADWLAPLEGVRAAA